MKVGYQFIQGPQNNDSLFESPSLISPEIPGTKNPQADILGDTNHLEFVDVEPLIQQQNEPVIQEQEHVIQQQKQPSPENCPRSPRPLPVNH